MGGARNIGDYVAESVDRESNADSRTEQSDPTSDPSTKQGAKTAEGNLPATLEGEGRRASDVSESQADHDAEKHEIRLQPDEISIHLITQQV